MMMQESLQTFESNVDALVAKAAKKNKLRAKKAEERERRERAEAEARAAAAQQLREKLEAEARARADKQLAEQQARQAAEDAARAQQRAMAHRAELQRMWIMYNEYAEERDRLQKRLKAARKKLREISDLEAKAKDNSSALSADQKTKMSKKEDVQREISELESLEHEMEARQVTKPDEPNPDAVEVTQHCVPAHAEPVAVHHAVVELSGVKQLSADRTPVGEVVAVTSQKQEPVPDQHQWTDVSVAKKKNKRR